MRAANKTKYFRKRTRRFNKNFPSVGRGMRLAGKVFGLQKQVRFMKGMINSERQYSDVAIDTQFSTTAALTLLNSMAEGDDVSDRKGNSVLHKYLSIKGTITMSGSATYTSVRIIYFIDLSGQGSTPSATDLLEFSSVHSLKNKDHSSRFAVLRDRRYDLSINGDRGTACNEYIKTNIHCKYTGSTSTAVYTNSIYILIVSSEATNTPTVTLNIRNAYYDN